MEFDECIDTFDDKLTFADMNLSRPLVKALSSMNFVKPTPIQSATVPVALKGRDVCACAVTGSGKLVLYIYAMYLTLCICIHLVAIPSGFCLLRE